MAHPPRSNPPLRSSSGPPRPCITPSTETFVLVVSFMVTVPFPLVWSSFGSTGRFDLIGRGTDRATEPCPLTASFYGVALDSNAGRVEKHPPKGRSGSVEFCAVRPTRAPRASLGAAGPDFREHAFYGLGCIKWPLVDRLRPDGRSVDLVRS